MVDKPIKMYFISAIIVLVIWFVASLIANSHPPISVVEAQSILQTLISLDGVLFGFSAVMIGLVFGSQKKISKKLATFSGFLILVSFLCYLVSLGQSFSYLYSNIQNGVLTPVFLTLIGAFCSSIYMVMLFIEEQESTIRK